MFDKLVNLYKSTYNYWILHFKFC